ncbi:MAG: outer membrane beta-barrel protein, partial [Bacteroidota bacterium]|nr:outer membrane beta-barrel protein [Bacteroidota bacterium]
SRDAKNEKESSKIKLDDERNVPDQKDIKNEKTLSEDNNKININGAERKAEGAKQPANSAGKQQMGKGLVRKTEMQNSVQDKVDTNLNVLKEETRSGQVEGKNNIQPTENVDNKNTAANKKSQENLNRELASSREKYLNKVPFMVMQNELAFPGKIEAFSSNLKMGLDANLPIQNSVTSNTIASSKTIHSRKAKISLFSLTAFFSPDFVSSDLSDAHSRFGEDDRNKIEREEKFRFSSTVGLLVDYNIAKRWKLESGITYSTRVTDIQPKTIYARPDNNGNINYRFNCSAGYSYVTLDAAPPPISGDSVVTLPSSNTLHYIGVPLAIKYVLTNGRFSLVPGLGIAANFLTQGKLRTSIATSTGNKTATSNNIQGLKSTYFNGSASIGVQYKLNNAFELTFVPTMRFAISSINRNAPVKTNENSFGLAGGVIVNF